VGGEGEWRCQFFMGEKDEFCLNSSKSFWHGFYGTYTNSFQKGTIDNRVQLHVRAGRKHL